MRGPRRGLVAAGCVLALALTVAACGDDEPSDKAGGSGGSDDEAPALEDVQVLDGPAADVKVLDNVFEAENIQIKPGTTVTWTNDGRQNHDIIPVDEGAGWGVQPDVFLPDATYTYTFDQPGTYRYYCSLHGTANAGMVGAVVVEDQEG